MWLLSPQDEFSLIWDSWHLAHDREKSPLITALWPSFWKDSRKLYLFQDIAGRDHVILHAHSASNQNYGLSPTSVPFSYTALKSFDSFNILKSIYLCSEWISWHSLHNLIGWRIPKIHHPLNNGIFPCLGPTWLTSFYSEIMTSGCSLKFKKLWMLEIRHRSRKCWKKSKDTKYFLFLFLVFIAFTLRKHPPHIQPVSILKRGLLLIF